MPLEYGEFVSTRRSDCRRYVNFFGGLGLDGSSVLRGCGVGMKLSTNVRDSTHERTDTATRTLSHLHHMTITSPRASAPLADT